MKKSKLLLALVLGIFVVFSSCKKKDLSNGTNSSVNGIITGNVADTIHTENNMLTFNSFKEYEQMLENWSNVDFEKINNAELKVGFKSMYETYKEKNNLNNLPCDDIFLALILSPNAQIKIGTYVFTLNFEYEYVKAENSVNKDLETFSFDDDVLPILYEGAVREKSQYCTGKRENKYIQTHEAWIRYYRTGIYYSLYAQVNGSESYKNYISTNENYSWENKKQSDSGTFSTSGYGSLHYSIYKKARRLKSYSTNLHFKVNYSGSCDIENNCN